MPGLRRGEARKAVFDFRRRSGRRVLCHLCSSRLRPSRLRIRLHLSHLGARGRSAAVHRYGFVSSGGVADSAVRFVPLAQARRPAGSGTAQVGTPSRGSSRVWSSHQATRNPAKISRSCIRNLPAGASRRRSALRKRHFLGVPDHEAQPLAAAGAKVAQLPAQRLEGLVGNESEDHRRGAGKGARAETRAGRAQPRGVRDLGVAGDAGLLAARSRAPRARASSTTISTIFTRSTPARPPCAGWPSSGTSR